MGWTPQQGLGGGSDVEEPEASRSVLTPVPGISWGLTLAAVSSQSEQEKRTEVHNPGDVGPAESPQGPVTRQEWGCALSPWTSGRPVTMMPAPCSWAVSSQNALQRGCHAAFQGAPSKGAGLGTWGGTAALCPVPPAPTRPFWKTRPLIPLITLCLESPSGALLAKGHLLGCLRAEPQERGTPYPKKPLIDSLEQGH